MTDLERIELALHRTRARFLEDPYIEIGMTIIKFLDQLIVEVQRQNQIAFEIELSRTKVKS